jgi:hypothetical protein|tara:strand:- start:704 stop:1327 length:624 start_codon:yes stop_codon:yes gene_type:complete
MGFLTRTAMTDQVEAILTRTDLTTQVKLRLDWAYEDVADSKEWQVLLIEDKTTALVTSQQDYALPTELRTAKYMTLVDDTGSSKVFTSMTAEDIGEWFDRSRNLTEDTGQPKIYTLVGNKIRTFPIPSATENTFKLYIVGHKKVSYFSGDSSITDLDQKLDRAIIYRAAQFCYDDLLEESEEALRYKNKADEAVDNAFADELAYSAL